MVRSTLLCLPMAGGPPGLISGVTQNLEFLNFRLEIIVINKPFESDGDFSTKLCRLMLHRTVIESQIHKSVNFTKRTICDFHFFQISNLGLLDHTVRYSSMYLLSP